MHGSVQPEDRFPPATPGNVIAGTDRSSVSAAEAVGPIEVPADKSTKSRSLEETELDSALQLLVERAQYITGATGTALALPHGDEMVCRASAGSSAPVVGASLQVRSGLTGESIARRQLLRCDNAEADPRVNLETCRALGIASIVVLPLLRKNGEVRGLFELFSDHPYAFEERDLIALERMADLTLTALDLAEQRHASAHEPTPRQEPEKPTEDPIANRAPKAFAAPLDVSPIIPPGVEIAEPATLPGATPAPSSVTSITTPLAPPATTPETPEAEPEPAAAPVPEAMRRVQKCASCGFPVSEGRALCLDCEKKDAAKKTFEKNQREQEQLESKQSEQKQDTPSASAAPAPEEFVPAFLANSEPVPESWLANHVNLLAVIVLILGIVVAVVVFR